MHAFKVINFVSSSGGGRKKLSINPLTKNEYYTYNFNVLTWAYPDSHLKTHCFPKFDLIPTHPTKNLAAHVTSFYSHKKTCRSYRLERSWIKIRIIAKMGIPSDKYQKDWKSRLRREKGLFFAT